MNVFKVQTYLAAVSDYDNVLTFTPDYVWSVEKVFRPWILFPRIEVGVIKNLRPAEIQSARQAIAHARVLMRKTKIKTRIMRVNQLNGKETKTVVWDNGSYIDTTILPWYWRFVRWCIGWDKKSKKPTKKKSEKK